MLAGDALCGGRSGGGRGGGGVGCVEGEHHNRTVTTGYVLLAMGVFFRRAVHVIQSLVEAQIYFLHLLLAFGISVAANVWSKPEGFADGIGHFDRSEVCGSARLDARLQEQIQQVEFLAKGQNGLEISELVRQNRGRACSMLGPLVTPKLILGVG